MKKLPRTNGYFGTFEYWKSIAIAFAIGIILIIPAIKIIPSCLSYWATNANITDAENVGYQLGWTDARHDKVEKLKAQREKMAEEDNVFNWCYSAESNQFAAFMRDASIVIIVLLFIGGIAEIGYVLNILKRDIKGYIAYVQYTRKAG